MLFSTSGCSNSAALVLRQLARQQQLVLQARPQADLHQLQVVLQPIELGLQATRVVARDAVECGTQVADHVIQHASRPARVGTDQDTQVGQRVEQHVRLELGLQQFEPRLIGVLARLAHLALEVGAAAHAVEIEAAHQAGQHRDEDGAAPVGCR